MATALGAAALVRLLAAAVGPGPAAARAMEPPPPPAIDPLPAILAAPSVPRGVVAKSSRDRLQVVLGLIDERPGRRPRLVQHHYRAGAEYVYPASTVKLLAAVAALEELAELRARTGLAIDADTPLVYHPLFPGEAREELDPTNLAGDRITVRHEIRKLFLVSDNEAFNRLYELVGPDGLARSAERAGLRGVRIVHRLSEPRTAEENLRLPRIDLVGGGFTHTLPERTARPLPPPPQLPGLLVGEAHLVGDERRNGPMDFTAKNHFPLAELQRALCMVVRPDVDCGGRGFRLGAEERALLLEAMGQLLAESANPVYDPAEHRDEEVEFLLPGLRRAVPPHRLRVFGKSGQAYGFTLDNAWVLDTLSQRSFLLAAALYANDDGVLNDDLYDYETVALPFLAGLGEAAALALWGGLAAPAPEGAPPPAPTPTPAPAPGAR
jgi:hypothetical protein